MAIRALGTLTTIAILFASHAGFAAPKQAEPVKAVGEAQQAKDAAYQAYEVSDYDTAISEYKKAYRLTSDARLFYNLGLSHRKRFELKRDRADAVEARDYFRRFVQLLEPTAPEHAAERTRLEQMHTLAQTYITEMEQALNKADAPPPERVAPPPVPRGPSRWGKILVITGAALAVTGGITGGLALKAQSDARDANASGDADATRSRGDSANRLALTTDLLFGTAIVSAGIGIYVVVTGRAKHRDRTAFSLSPRSVAFTVRY